MKRAQHHAWCAPGECTLDVVHRGPRKRVSVGRAAVESRIVQAASEERPSIVVTSSGWAHSKPARLTAKAVSELIANLTEQVAVISRDAPGPLDSGPVEGDRKG